MAKSDNALIVTENLTTGYGSAEVTKGVSISASSGEVIALIGPNGSGKSTLLKTIAGAIKPLSGSVAIAGQNVTELSKKEAAKLLAYVPQFESPAFDYTAQQIVLMGRQSRAEGLFETQEDLQVAEKSLATVDASAFADRKITELSGGEQQRVLIARALAQEAPALLMDEPIAHLDVRHRLDLGSLLQELKILGKAVMVAVHDIDWAVQFTDRVVVLHEGEVLIDLPSLEAAKSPAIDRAFEVGFKRYESEDSVRLLPDQSEDLP